MSQPTIASLIRSLGYCCPWLFFRLFPSTAQAALRLGCNPRSIRKEKARAAAGCEGCRGCCAHRAEEMRRRLAERSVQEINNSVPAEKPNRSPGESGVS